MICILYAIITLAALVWLAGITVLVLIYQADREPQERWTLKDTVLTLFWPAVLIWTIGAVIAEEIRSIKESK